MRDPCANSVISAKMQCARRSSRFLAPVALLAQAAGVEFIPENGGGPGVRLRKP